MAKFKKLITRCQTFKAGDYTGERGNYMSFLLNKVQSFINTSKIKITNLSTISSTIPSECGVIITYNVTED